MTALIILLFCKVVAVVVVGGLLWVLVPAIIEDWCNPPKHWTWYATQKFQEDLGRIRKREAQRQKLIDQL